MTDHVLTCVHSIGSMLLTFLCLKCFPKKHSLGCQRKGADFSQGNQKRFQGEVASGCWRKVGVGEFHGVGESWEKEMHHVQRREYVGRLLALLKLCPTTLPLLPFLCSPWFQRLSFWAVSLVNRLLGEKKSCVIWWFLKSRSSKGVGRAMSQIHKIEY